MRIATNLLALITLISALPAVAEERDARNWRSEIGLYMQSWPALTDLQPSEGGSFNSVGFGFLASAHWPVKQWESSRLLLGFDFSLGATESGIPGVASDVMARQKSSAGLHE